MSRFVFSSIESDRQSGEFNMVEMFWIAGEHEWELSEFLDARTPVLVNVWGAGGAQGVNTAGTGRSTGGGGGGLAVKRIFFPEIISAASEIGGKKYVTITVGEGSKTHTGVGGTSSFGNIVSATGGNSGFNNSDNEGLEVFGAGGLGIGGDRNRRGGSGGGTNNPATSAGAGGGGSAPAPYGFTDGFDGGINSGRGGGGGGGIGGAGGRGSGSNGGGGGGSAGPGSPITNNNPSNQTPSPGGNGLIQSSAIGYQHQNPNQVSRSTSGGGFILNPNEIVFGGAGGVGGLEYTSSSTGVPGHGGPGAGGGGINRSSSTTSNIQYISAGNGGLLGGGGGASNYNIPGHGGNAGGGGAAGYEYGTGRGYGFGGDGLVIVQYRVR
jgi:hypothetical protein